MSGRADVGHQRTGGLPRLEGRREREHAGRYEFLVEAAMPGIGRLIRYEGWLAPA